MNIFISGVSSGLGHALTEYYLKQNHCVYGVSRRHPQDLEKYPNFHFLSQDLSQFDKIDLAPLLSDCQRLDLVILNAGQLQAFQTIQNTEIKDLQAAMDINLWAQKACLDSLLKHCNRIYQVVGISSGAAINGNAGWGAYSLSKAAFVMLIKLYASENPNIHFTSLAPGLVDTPMQDFIYTEVDPQEFPSVDRIQKAKGTSSMPSPESLAPKFEMAMGHCLDLPSGSFQDIRNLEV